MTTYIHNGDLVPGEWGAASSYFAPTRKFSITPGMVFTYNVFMRIGEVNAMRAAFYKLNK